MDMTPFKETNEEIAERIITFEGFGFALAYRFENSDDIRKARQLLKEAIVNALVNKENSTRRTLFAMR